MTDRMHDIKKDRYLPDFDVNIGEDEHGNPICPSCGEPVCVCPELVAKQSERILELQQENDEHWKNLRNLNSDFITEQYKNAELESENNRLKHKISEIHFDLWSLSHKHKAELVIRKY